MSKKFRLPFDWQVHKQMMSLSGKTLQRNHISKGKKIVRIWFIKDMFKIMIRYGYSDKEIGNMLQCMNSSSQEKCMIVKIYKFKENETKKKLYLTN